MSTFVIKNGKAFFQGVDISGITNRASLSYEAEVKDETTMADTTRKRKGGLLSVGAEMAGFWSATEELEMYGKIAGDGVFSYLSPGAAAGDRVYFLQGAGEALQFGDRIGEIMPYSFSLQSNKPLIQGKLLENKVGTADGNSAALELPAVPDGSKLWVALHVYAFSGTSLDVVIESDVDDTFADPTEEIAFTLVEGTGAQMLSADGPITNTFYRVVWDVTSATWSAVVSIGISDK